MSEKHEHKFERAFLKRASADNPSGLFSVYACLGCGFTERELELERKLGEARQRTLREAANLICPECAMGRRFNSTLGCHENPDRISGCAAKEIRKLIW